MTAGFKRCLLCTFVLCALGVCISLQVVRGGIEFRTVVGQYPVQKFKLTMHGDRLEEIVVFVQDGVPTDSLVDISSFVGLDYRMTAERAKQQLGNPQKVEPLQEMGGLSMHRYSVPKGEVGFIAVPSSATESKQQHQVWAFPSNGTPAATILDESLRSQLLTLLPKDRAIRVSILRAEGSGGPTVNMSVNRVYYVILGMRDGER